MTDTAATPSSSTQRSLVRKLAEVMAAVERIPKNGFNKFHGYAYATEADVVDAVRSELAARQVMLLPSVTAHEVRDIVTAGGKSERLVTLSMTFTAHDGESGESLSFTALGQGQDPGDKAGYKAATGATKYALMKLFLIPTGDDPEADSKAPEKPAPPKAKPLPKPSEPKRAPNLNALVMAFAGLGVTEAMLVSRVGHSLETLSEAEVADLRAYHQKKKEIATADPDAEARRLESEKAEAGIAKEKADKAAKAESAKTAAEVATASGEMRKQIDARMAQLDKPPETPAQTPASMAGTLTIEQRRNAAFAAMVARIKAGASVEAVTLLASEAAGEKLLFGAGEKKALARAAEDRTLILRDAEKEAKRPPRAEAKELF